MLLVETQTLLPDLFLWLSGDGHNNKINAANSKIIITSASDV